jgi:hypothetical protein
VVKLYDPAAVNLSVQNPFASERVPPVGVGPQFEVLAKAGIAAKELPRVTAAIPTKPKVFFTFLFLLTNISNDASLWR